MGVRTTEHFPVKENYYYIMDFKRFMFPVLMPVYFVNKNAAKRILESNVPNRNRRRMFSIYSGRKIKKERLKYIIGWGHYMIRGGKYPYPRMDMTDQEKKSFRTLLRRRLRRMDLLTTIKAKYRYDNKGKKIKHKKNYQKVAKSPGTDAKVFQLDRKPKSYHYIILKKRSTTKRGKIFMVRAIRVNIKTGEFKKVTIYINRNDIIFPGLLEHLKRIPNARPAIESYTAVNKKRKEKILR